MDRRERREILGQWGVREPTGRERAAGEAVAADLEGSPLKGRPFRLRRRHFRASADTYIASLGGPLPYMIRLRGIERLTVRIEVELGERWGELAAECSEDPAGFGRRWRAAVAGYDFGEVNELIRRHNRWYPAEARLAMDVRTRDYVLVNGERYSREPLDAAWALERFPPELDSALTAPGAGAPGR